MHTFKKTEDGYVDENGVFWTQEEVDRLEADRELQEDMANGR